jgi:hypothetical protein
MKTACKNVLHDFGSRLHMHGVFHVQAWCCVGGKMEIKNRRLLAVLYPRSLV